MFFSLRSLWAFATWCGAVMSTSLSAAQSLEDLAREPTRWPAEVTVTATTRATVIEQDKPAGAMLLGAGRTFSVSKISAEGIVGKLGQATVLVPAEKTDLWTRLGASSAPVARVSSATTPSASGATVGAASSRPREAPTLFEIVLQGKLVSLRGGRVQPFDAGRLNGVKFYGLYFSASWCGPCRQFTPELIQDYAAIRAVYPEFEIILVSRDRSEADMLNYLREDQMPWPALRFADRQLSQIAKHAGRGIPCLVLVDANGKELSHSYRWGRYVGPQQVVEDTWRILKEARRKRGGAE